MQDTPIRSLPMQGFEYRGDTLYCEAVALESIAAEAGTPSYVYSAEAIRANFRAYKDALSPTPNQIHYAVKANSSLGVLSLLAAEGAGFDIVSGGELFRVLKAGGDPSKVVFSGVGKTAAEMRYAIEQGIRAFHCESLSELELLRTLAVELGATPNVSLRVNPNINADTHPYIATGLAEHKFGIPMEEAAEIYQNAAELEPLRFTGVSCHIGSQIFDTAAFGEALSRVLELARRLRDSGLPIETLDLGGGLGVGYARDEASASIAGYGSMLAPAVEGTGFTVAIEPGRSIVGQAGVLLTKVLYTKCSGEKTFVIVDGAMNDLIRPALYSAHHEVVPVRKQDGPTQLTDVVGPVCETGDFLARGRNLQAFAADDLLVLATAGAYGFVLSSNYNSRPRAAEVLVEGSDFRVIRRRETWEDLIEDETP